MTETKKWAMKARWRAFIYFSLAKDSEIKS